MVDGVIYRRFEKPDGTLLYRQTLVPRILRKEFLHFIRDHVTSGHFGVKKTQENCMRYACWSGCRKDVEVHVRRCEACSRSRKEARFRHEALQYAPGLTVMQKFHIDLTGPHVRSRNGFVYLLTGYCCFSKYLVAVPLRDKTALSVVGALATNVNRVYGSPEIVVSDRGGEFINEILRNVHRLMGVQSAPTTSYRFSSNGVVKRVHSTINRIFTKMVCESLTNWCKMTSYVVLAYDCAYHTGTTFSPSYLMFLREPRVSLDLALDGKSSGNRFGNLDDYTDLRWQRMERTYESMGGTTKEQFDRMKNAMTAG